MKDHCTEAAPPPVTEEALHAWADARLDAPGRARLAPWLDEQPGQAERVRDWQAQRESLQALYGPVLEQPVPARLSGPLRPAPRRWPLALAAALSCALLGGIVGWRLGLQQTSGAELPLQALSRQAAIAHAVYVPEKRHPVEVGANEEAHLVAWLSRRLEAPLKVPDLNPEGFQLVGGRLLPSEKGPGAQLMYERNDGLRLTLYLSSRPDEDSATTFRYAREGDISVFYWVEAPFAYALSAQMAREPLLGIARAAYRQLQP